MTQPHVPAEPEATARLGQAPPPALHLAYATPQPARAQWPEFRDVVAMLIRRALFALGAGLLVAGLVEAFGTRRGGDAAVMAGWGAALVALVVPFPAMWRYWPTDPPPGGRTR
jgi:hypothetical protein